MWVHAAVASILILHISAGSIAMLSGAAALSVRKGERLHRVLGTVFFVSMLTMAVMATSLAIWIQQWSNMAAGAFAFYLVATGWVTVRRKEGTVGSFELGAMIVAFGGTIAALIFGLIALVDPKTIPTGSPVQAVFVLAGVIGFAAAMDLKVIMRGGISGVGRIARHVWRMCLGFANAWVSFYVQVVLRKVHLPAFLHHSPLLYIPIVAPLLLVAFWVIRVRFTNRFKGIPIAT
jgi:hypothetical protein